MVSVTGERWFPDTASFAEQMSSHWGNWHCDSEVGRLRDVLMRRPGAEVDAVNASNFASYRWRDAMDGDLARGQHDAVADLYRAHGVTVHYVEDQRADRPNALYCRDQVFMTPEGAIVGRLAIAARRGEERAVAKTLADLGVPVLRTINGDGVFEGACALWVNRQTVILGSGARANAVGVAQVAYELRNIGVADIIPFQIPYGHAHLDGLINFADTDKVVLFPWQVPYDVVKPLLDIGYHVIEVDDIAEAKDRFATNFVALEPGVVVAASGTPNTHAKMRDAGIKVLTLDVGEILKGWGSLHCMTAFLRRDPVGEVVP